MADISGIARTGIIKSLNHLVKCGYVEKKDRYRSDGSQSSNIYRILYDHNPDKKHLRGKYQGPSKQDTPVPPEVTPPVPSENTPPVPPEGTPPVLSEGTPNEHPTLTPQVTTPIEQGRFSEFWAVYPVKKDRKTCAQKWKSRNLDRLADMIIADVTRRRIDDVQWQNGYIPHPKTYINGDKWEDEIQTKTVGNNNVYQTNNNAAAEWLKQSSVIDGELA